MNNQALKFLGMANTAQLPKGGSVGNISLSTLMIAADSLLSLTGDAGFNGFILKSRDSFAENFSFASGYLTSYISRYSLGQIPTIEMSALIFGDMGRNRSKSMPALNTAAQGLKIPGAGSIDISFADFETNRVTSYDININVNRTPVYSIGNKSPVAVYRSNPIEVTCAFQIEISNYAYNRIKDYPENKVMENLSLTVKDFNTNQAITSYSFSNLELVSQSYNTSVDSDATLNLQYKTLITV